MDQTDASAGLSRRTLLRGIAAGGATVAAAGSATAQEAEVVEMTDSLAFEPADLTITPGTTVEWENVGSVPHSVTAYEDDIPEDATYFASGGFESESAARGAWPNEGDIGGGETYSHTFEVEGTYEYMCIPHEGAGMVGTIEVSTDTGGGEATGPAVPDSAKTIVVATVAAMVSTLALAYTFIKFGGGPPEE